MQLSGFSGVHNYAQFICTSCNVQGRGLLGSDLVRGKLFGLVNPETFEEKKNIIFFLSCCTCTVYVYMYLFGDYHVQYIMNYHCYAFSI